MKNNSSNNASSGIGFTGLLTLIFIVLKLTGVIQWAWWWVLSPIWISVALILLVVLIYVIYYLIVNRKDK